METIGQILKNAREKKGLTIEELASSTYIIPKFIKALEDEQFDLLPGEIYVKGFIKNISDKLSLDSDAMIERYNLQKNENKFEEDLSKSRKFKIVPKKKESKSEAKKEEIKETNNENPKEENKENKENKKEDINKTSSTVSVNSKTYTPSSAEAELLYITKRDLNKIRNKKSISFVPIIVILAILVVLAVIFFNINNIKSMFSSNNNDNRREVEIARNIVDNNARQNVKPGDIIYFKPLGISATIKFNSVGNVIRMNINGQDLSFSKSNPIILDLNGNGINDFKISIIEVYDNLATVEMEKLEENQMINSAYNEENTNYLNNVTNNVAVSSDAKLPVIDGETYIEQDTEKSNIRIEITAKHFVYLRYFIDSGGPATTNLLSGKTLYLEARDVMMLTIGNAGEVVVKVNGKIVDVGAAGETVNKTIKWTKNLNDSTKYNLIMTDTK
ncbi:helix-turn-helix domain-containing protein [Brachyspira sp. SAP_772]|uniref:helix-turn-helix domain-containing protein n=1 Tax=Brachyspira sp. SAP_772 TaxID=2608385 RepID=UPI0012F4DB0E|nr:helix-turn-helix domain-containing protein [Brachyspira sp. SAP_772]